MELRIRNGALRRLALFGTTGCAFGLAAGPAIAQNDPEATTISEIIVTVGKREEQLQEVPAAVSALGSDQLIQQQIFEARDLSGRVPGLRVTSSGGRASPQVFLRGVGTSNFNPESALPIGLYQDEVYFNTGPLATEPYFDIERIEVARGPQGTLFGKNTTGGAINVITRKPTEQAGGYGLLTYGRFNQLDIEGAGGGAIIEGKLSGRAAFTRLSRDGFVTNLMDGSTYGRYADTAARLQLRWTPTYNADILFKVRARTLDSHPVLYRHVGFRPDFTDAFGYRFTGSLSETNNNVSDPPGDVRSAGAQVTANIDLGFASLVTIGSYDKANSHFLYDDDGGPIDVERSNYVRAFEQTTFETRLVSPAEDLFSWIVGYHYFFENLGSKYQFLSQHPLFGFGIAGLFGQETTSHAFYGSFKYQFTEALALLGGMRYTTESKDADLLGLSYRPNVVDPYNPFLSTTPLVVTSRQSEERRWGEPTGDLTLQYQPSEDLNFYAKYARGFRAGGFNSGAYNQAAVTSVDPEKIDSFEVGAKTQWLDRRLVVNVAAFYYDFTDRQTFQFQGSTAVLVNAGIAKYKGVDLEVIYQPIDNLTLAATTSWIASHVGGYDARGPDGVVRTVDNKNRRVESASLVADYSIPLATGEVRLHTDWVYRGETNYGFTEGVGLGPEFNFLKEDPYWIGNVRVTYAPTDRFEISLWGRNITDERRMVVAYTLFSRIGGEVISDPRTYGVTLRTRF